MSNLASLFPPPPSYYKLYTADYLEKDELSPPEVPDPQLRPTYRSFGSIWNLSDTLPSLAESEVPQLYSQEENINVAEELKKLNAMVLQHFLALVHTLQKNPAEFPSRLETLQHILVNMHHLLNTFRSAQSGRELADFMAQQLAAQNARIDATRQLIARVELQISKLKENL